MSLSAVLEFKNADKFLSLDSEELFTRVEHLRDNTDKDYPDILKGKAGSLIKNSGQTDASLNKKHAAKKFQDQNKDIVDRVTEAFSKSDISGQFKIKPASGSDGNQVMVTITVPKNQLWQAFDAVSNANNSHPGKVIRKKKSNSGNKNLETGPKDVSAGMHGGKISR
jgi:hypothetical protein